MLIVIGCVANLVHACRFGVGGADRGGRGVVRAIVQVTQFKIPGTPLVIGSGLLSVMGVSFSFVPVAQQVIATLSECACNGAPCPVGGGECDACPVPLVGKCHSAEDAYGKVLGTVSACSPQPSLELEPLQTHPHN